MDLGMNAVPPPAIRYADGNCFTVTDMIGLFRRVHPNRAGDDSTEDVEQMFAHANLTATAWMDSLLVGFARAFTDFHFVAYLADLAVDSGWQRRGIGRGLIRRVMARLAPGAKLVLLSTPEANGFYLSLGCRPHPHGWMIIK